MVLIAPICNGTRFLHYADCHSFQHVQGNLNCSTNPLCATKWADTPLTWLKASDLAEGLEWQGPAP